MTEISSHERRTGLTLHERWVELCFDLRLGSRYHVERRRFFEHLHTVVAGLSAILGSAAVVALLTDYAYGKHIAIAASALVAVAAALDSVVGFSSKARSYADLARRFMQLERQFLLAEPSEQIYAELLAQRRAIESDEPPAVPYLVRRCHHELARHDGYEPGEEGYPPAMSWFTRAFAQWLWFAAPSH